MLRLAALILLLLVIVYYVGQRFYKNPRNQLKNVRGMGVVGAGYILYHNDVNKRCEKCQHCRARAVAAMAEYLDKAEDLHAHMTSQIAHNLKMHPNERRELINKTREFKNQLDKAKEGFMPLHEAAKREGMVGKREGMVGKREGMSCKREGMGCRQREGLELSRADYDRAVRDYTKEFDQMLEAGEFSESRFPLIEVQAKKAALLSKYGLKDVMLANATERQAYIISGENPDYASAGTKYAEDYMKSCSAGDFTVSNMNSADSIKRAKADLLNKYSMKLVINPEVKYKEEEELLNKSSEENDKKKTEIFNKHQAGSLSKDDYMKQRNELDAVSSNIELEKSKLKTKYNIEAINNLNRLIKETELDCKQEQMIAAAKRAAVKSQELSQASKQMTKASKDLKNAAVEAEKEAKQASQTVGVSLSSNLLPTASMPPAVSAAPEVGQLTKSELSEIPANQPVLMADIAVAPKAVVKPTVAQIAKGKLTAQPSAQSSAQPSAQSSAQPSAKQAKPILLKNIYGKPLPQYKKTKTWM